MKCGSGEGECLNIHHFLPTSSMDDDALTLSRRNFPSCQKLSKFTADRNGKTFATSEVLIDDEMRSASREFPVRRS